MKLSGLLMGSALLFAAAQASAGTIVLNFDTLNGAPDAASPFGYDEILQYYNGGTDLLGATGPNDGVSFTSNAIVGCEAGFACADTNTAEAPSAPNIMFFLSGAAATINVAAGFTTGFSFFYSAVNQPGVINVWSGLNDTGTLLATLNLPTTPANGNPGCGGEPFCPYSPIGVTFAGTAMSVDFGGTENQIAFDNITFGSASPGVPEPATWGLMLLGIAGIGAAARLSRRQLATA
jgi:hypothetical protein